MKIAFSDANLLKSGAGTAVILATEAAAQTEKSGKSGKSSKAPPRLTAMGESLDAAAGGAILPVPRGSLWPWCRRNRSLLSGWW
jgi:hypothetical protein